MKDLTKNKEHIETVEKFKEFLKLGDIVGRKEDNKESNKVGSSG